MLQKSQQWFITKFILEIITRMREIAKMILLYLCAIIIYK